MEYFKLLPGEITLDILIRVPTESVLNCKLVCTNWRNLVGDPWFSKMHLHRHNHLCTDSGKLGFVANAKIFGETRINEFFHYFEFNENHDQSTTPIERIRRINFTSPFSKIRLVGSSNGLICLLESLPSWRELRLCICNPITREYVVLPRIKSDYLYTNHHRCQTNGFGYVSSTNEYKVVGIYMLQNTQFVEVHIYTLGSGLGWRNIGNINSELGKYPLSLGIFVNGALYWMISESKIIVTFDLAEEKFCEHLSPPPLPPDRDWDFSKIGVLDGCLIYSNYPYEGEEECYDIWLLRKENDSHVMKEREREEHQSFVWSKEFRVDESELFAVTKTGGVLTYVRKHLNFYNPTTSTSKILVDLMEWIGQVYPHKNTLVSLKELGEEDTMIMESVEVEDTESHNHPLKKQL